MNTKTSKLFEVILSIPNGWNVQQAAKQIDALLKGPDKADIEASFPVDMIADAKSVGVNLRPELFIEGPFSEGITAYEILAEDILQLAPKQEIKDAIDELSSKLRPKRVAESFERWQREAIKEEERQIGAGGDSRAPRNHGELEAELEKGIRPSGEGVYPRAVALPRFVRGLRNEIRDDTLDNTVIKKNTPTYFDRNDIYEHECETAIDSLPEIETEERPVHRKRAERKPSANGSRRK
jgi:hypothetical protein